MDTIQASPNQLIIQAQETANSHLIAAKTKIDRQFGEGYAEKNPGLVSAFISCATFDLSTSFILAAIQDFSATHY